MNLFLSVKNKIRNYISKGDSVIACVSGGPDSVAMLNLLFIMSKREKFRLFVAHFNHKMRGRESRRDAAYVKKLAFSYGLPFIYGEKDINKISKKSGFGPEKTAREERYRFFIREASKRKANKIALGHNLEDNSETIIYRFIKGAGSEGLTGIPAIRAVNKGEFGLKVKNPPVIIRPLIGEQRKDIVSYLKKEGVKFSADRTNKENFYERNRIRNKLIPFIEKNFNKNFKYTLSGTAAILAAENSFIQSVADYVYPEIVFKKGRFLYIDSAGFRGMNRAVRIRVIRAALKKLLAHHRNITFNLIIGIEEALLSGRTAHLPENLEIKKKKNNMAFSKRKQKTCRGRAPRAPEVKCKKKQSKIQK